MSKRTSYAPRTKPLRRRYFLYRFQTKYALAFVVLSIFVATVIAFVCFKVFNGLGVDMLSDDAAFEKNLRWLVAGVGALTISSFGSFYLLITLATSRLSAPIALLTEYMGELANGGYPAMQPLPEEDPELREIFLLLRSAIDEFRSRHLDEIATLQQALQALATVKTSSEVQNVQLEFQNILQRRFRAANDLESPLNSASGGASRATFAGLPG